MTYLKLLCPTVQYTSVYKDPSSTIQSLVWSRIWIWWNKGSNVLQNSDGRGRDRIAPSSPCIRHRVQM